MTRSISTDQGFLWINGQATPTLHSFAVYNPTNETIVSICGDGNATQFVQAIDAAHNAFATWQFVAAEARATAIEDWAAVIESASDRLAELVVAESGKLRAHAGHEIAAGVAALRWAAAQARRDCEETLESSGPTQRRYTLKKPIGVVACVTPWNFPVASVLVKAGPAIAAGCTLVVKPSEETPLIALELARLSRDAGLPDGVFNVIPTSKPAAFGDVLKGDTRVRSLSFTGSTAVGKRLYADCAQTVKRVSLEMGGNAPFIVFADADIDRAVNDAMGARFYNSGQICVGANRFYIHEGVHDEFCEKLAKRVAALKAGDGMDPASDVGPVINVKAKARITALIEDAITKGARVLAGGNETSGNFVAPTLLCDVTEDMDARHSEIFGPVAFVSKFKDVETVVALANATKAGLAAYAYSRDLSFLSEIGHRLEAGMVGLNSTNIFSEDMPFGGIKESGIGREHGAECLEEYREVISLVLEHGDTQ